MKKVLVTVLSLLFILTLSVTAFAAEEEFEESAAKGDTGADESPFSEIYSIICENTDKIFSALAFISSLILAFAYKRGALPLIKSGIAGIGKSAGELAEKSGEAIEKTEQTLSFLSERFAFCESSVESALASIEELGAKLESIEKNTDGSEKTKAVLLSQIDLLYDIFMQSSLPQYSKDAVGEKVTKMKKALAAGEENE